MKRTKKTDSDESDYSAGSAVLGKRARSDDDWAPSEQAQTNAQKLEFQS